MVVMRVVHLVVQWVESMGHLSAEKMVVLMETLKDTQTVL